MKIVDKRAVEILKNWIHLMKPLQNTKILGHRHDNLTL